MKDFAAIGCETANFERTSVSSVGVVQFVMERKNTCSTSLNIPNPTTTIMYARESTISTVKTLRMRP